jgi:diguanylate cyclase (GGDEF)-like protein
MPARGVPSVIKPDALVWKKTGIAGLLRAARPARADVEPDLRPPDEPQAIVPDAVRTLGFLLALSALLSAGAVIGRGYAYSDVVVLLAVQLATALIVWRVPWTRVDETWLLTIIGVQVVYVAALITLTGGGASPYFAFYAPVLALAGWHLRKRNVAIAVAFVVATELWRAVAVEHTAAIDQLVVALPAFALVAIFANLVSTRLLRSMAGNRRDQLRTAGTLHAVRSIGELPLDQPLALVTTEIADVFEAEAAIAGLGGDEEVVVPHRCPAPLARHHVRPPIMLAGSRLGYLELCRRDPFSSTERRLVAIVADALGRAVESRSLFAEVRSEAERDHLTGLLNRRAFDRDIRAAVERAERDDTALAVYFLDLDGFKNYNDTHGHAEGDVALQRIARALLAQVRDADQAYRFGGDEFVVIAAGVEGLEAILLAERLRLASMARIGVGRGYQLTVSVGMATCHGQGCSAAGLLREADAAMYREKAERRSPASAD